VLSGALSVLLLAVLPLFLRGTEATGVDQNALARIISKIQKEYSPYGEGQYAVAINVPVKYCSAGSNPDDGHFLKNDKPDAAKRAMKGDARVYKGQELIGATRKQSTTKGFLHSEYLLLRDPDEEHSLMMNLLNKKKDGCVIFYTLNSPCIGTCLYEDGGRHILKALSMIKGRANAFVYTQIFHRDAKNGELEEYLNNVHKEVPLYRCYPVRDAAPSHDRSPRPGHSRNRPARPGHSRNRSPEPGHSRNRPARPGHSRNRSPEPGHSRDRSRSHSPMESPSSDRDSYECHLCFNSDDIAQRCIEDNLLSSEWGPPQDMAAGSSSVRRAVQALVCFEVLGGGDWPQADIPCLEDFQCCVDGGDRLVSTEMNGS
ncbi:hypothetical protein NFI96_009404, partial [Prochilodus magdalenae]